MFVSGIATISQDVEPRPLETSRDDKVAIGGMSMVAGPVLG